MFSALAVTISKKWNRRGSGGRLVILRTGRDGRDYQCSRQSRRGRVGGGCCRCSNLGELFSPSRIERMVANDNGVSRDNSLLSISEKAHMRNKIKGGYNELDS